MVQWATIERKAYLVDLFRRCGGFCVYGERPCTDPEHHHYVHFVEGLIANWIAEDRECNLALWQAEQRRIHNLHERGNLKGEFGAISRDIFHSSQPEYYLMGFGMNTLTFRPFAKVRLASSFVSLYIDVSGAMRKLSKNQRRKATRYGRPLSHRSKAEIDQMCSLAVKDYYR